MKHGTTYAYKDGCRCDPCRTAKIAYQREWRDRSGDPTELGLHWPLANLFEAAGTTEYLALADLTGINARTLHRAANRGLPDRSADRAATNLGLHPSLIWPDWFDPYLQGAAA